MPGEGVTIDTDTGVGGCCDEFLHVVEIHVTIAIYAAGHLHGVTCNGFAGVLTDHVPDQGIIEVFGSNAQLEIGILVMVDVFLECFVFI